MRNKIRRLIALAAPAMELLWHWGQKPVVVELLMAGELPYLLPLLQNAAALPGIRLVLVPRHDHDLKEPRVAAALRPLRGSFSIMTADDVRSLAKWFRFAGLVTCEQFSCPLLRPAVCIFHGQPSKGLTFNRQIIENFDHFFHLGPLHREALAELVATEQVDPQTLPQLHDVGYPKSDSVIGGTMDPHSLPFAEQLQSYRTVLLYAPAFNEYGTLRTMGMELIATVAALPETCVIVKLAPDSIAATDNFYATGGVDWKARIESMQIKNVFLSTDLDINPCLVASDIMITDVSGVAYEFLVTGKPVVFFDCPEFYQHTVSPANPTLTLSEIIERDTINGGRRYGTVVRSLPELTQALSQPLPAPNADQMQNGLLYNPGCATAVMLKTLTDIFARQY